MTLQHDLRRTRARVPEVHAAVLGARQNPLRIGRQRDGEDKVAVALEGLDAFASLRRLRTIPSGPAELPHLDSAVQTAADKLLAVGREGDRVDGVSVTIRTLEALCEVASVDVPHTDALIKRAGGNIVGVGGDGHGGDTILDGEGEGVGTLLDIPESDGAITTAGRNGAAITREVERVNVLLVAGEVVANRPSLNVPNLFSLLAFDLYFA